MKSSIFNFLFILLIIFLIEMYELTKKIEGSFIFDIKSRIKFE